MRNADHPAACTACGRTDNDSGIFIWLIPSDPVPFCPGECVGQLLDALKTEGMAAEAADLETSIGQQLAGGCGNNVRFLDSKPPTKPFHKDPLT